MAARTPPQDDLLHAAHAPLAWSRPPSILRGDRAAPMAVGSVGVIGAGVMGTAIAAAELEQGLSVVICESDPTSRRLAPSRIVDLLTQTLSPAQSQATVDRLLRITSDESTVGRCDLVVESIVETPTAKRALFARLEPHLSERTILATNTSTIPIARLAEEQIAPDRFCGFHFFHPVAKRRLVEIIRGSQTSDQTIAAAVAHAKAIGKLPIVVDDGAGFLVNRLLLPYLGEALDLLLDGVTIDQIERAALDFGMAKGPLHLLDEIGLDTVLQGGWILYEAFSDRLVPSPLLVAMVKAGRLGCKSGIGFFEYGRPKQAPDPALQRLIDQWARSPRPHTPKAIIARLILPMVLEATRILEEGKVRDPQDIDLGVVFGLGFPATHGGLLGWADSIGAAGLLEMLQSLALLGPRAEPTDLLLRMARTADQFHSMAPAIA